MSEPLENKNEAHLVLAEYLDEDEGASRSLHCSVSPIFEYYDRTCYWGVPPVSGETIIFPMAAQEYYIQCQSRKEVRSFEVLSSILEKGLFEVSELKSRLQGYYPDVVWPSYRPTKFQFCCLHWVLVRLKMYLASNFRFSPHDPSTFPDLKLEVNVSPSTILLNLDCYPTLAPFCQRLIEIAGQLDHNLAVLIVEFFTHPHLGSFESEKDFTEKRNRLQEKVDEVEKHLQLIAWDLAIFPEYYPKDDIQGQNSAAEANQELKNYTSRSSVNPPTATETGTDPSVVGAGDSPLPNSGKPLEPGSTDQSQKQNNVSDKTVPLPKKNLRRGRRRKDSEELTDADELIVAYLRMYHGYENVNFSCGNTKALTMREIAAKASNPKMSTQTVSAFFKRHLPNSKYKRVCGSGNSHELGVLLAGLSREDLLRMHRLKEELTAESREKQIEEDE